MGLYTVVRPCVVANLHYALVPTTPIDADDTAAAPLVESGDLVPVDGGEKPPAKVAPHRRRADKED